MRHLMTSFLALHWAAFFALLGYLCIDGGGLRAALAFMGLQGAGQPQFATAPMAVAFLLVAALFCWVLVESCLGENGQSEGIVKVAFVAGGLMFSLILIHGALHNDGNSSGVILSLSALMVSYLATLGERWTALFRNDASATQASVSARAMARDAANTSLLSRISGRPDFEREL